MVVGALEAQDKTGFRVSVTGGEALAMLFEISSGNLLALMGYPFSKLRISATVGLAIERFTDAAARTVAMIGSGRLALSALEPAAALRPIDRVLVYSRSADKREAFARKASEKLKIPVQAVDLAGASDRCGGFCLGEHEFAGGGIARSMASSRAVDLRHRPAQ